MVRTPCCKEEGIKKGAWTPEEDQKLIAYLQLHGEGGWRTLPEKAGLKRCGKSCRLRWANYLRPDIKRGEFSPEEDNLIIKLHALKGNKWAAIATSLAGRTDNEIKNYWNTNLKKRLNKKGLDPNTHKPVNTTNPEPPKPKPVTSSGSVSVLNRVASKYAVDLNKDLLSGIISGNSIIVENSQNSAEFDSLIMSKPNQYTASASSDNCSLSDDYFNDLFSKEEVSDMFTKVDNFGFMEELKGILSYDGNFKDLSEVNASDEMKFFDSWNEEDDMDLDKFVTLLDSKVGVFV